MAAASSRSASEGTARIWNAHTGREAVRLNDDARRVSSVAYSPDGRRIATGGRGEVVLIRDAATGAETALLTGPRGGANSIAYSPDGTRIASAADEGWLRTWQVGRPHSEMVNPEMVHLSFPGRRWVAFRPGRLHYVANSGAERHVRVRFDGRRCLIFRFLLGASSCPVYPLEWYRDVLRLDPQATDHHAALQRQDPDLRPQELRMVWLRINWLPVVSIGLVLVLVMLGVTFQFLRRRRDPLALMKEFFAEASDYDVQRRLTSHALLLGDRSAAHHYAVMNVNGADDVTSALARCTRCPKGVPLLFLIQPPLDSDRLHERTREACRIRADHGVDVVPMALATLERALMHVPSMRR